MMNKYIKFSHIKDINVIYITPNNIERIIYYMISRSYPVALG